MKGLDSGAQSNPKSQEPAQGCKGAPRAPGQGHCQSHLRHGGQVWALGSTLTKGHSLSHQGGTCLRAINNVPSGRPKAQGKGGKLLVPATRPDYG